MKHHALFSHFPTSGRVQSWLRSSGVTYLLVGLLALGLVSCQKPAKPQGSLQASSQASSQVSSQTSSQDEQETQVETSDANTPASQAGSSNPTSQESQADSASKASDSKDSDSTNSDSKNSDSKNSDSTGSEEKSEETSGDKSKEADARFGETEGLQAREFPVPGTKVVMGKEGDEAQHEVLPYDFDDWMPLQSKPILIDFWSPSCGPCQAIAPVIDDIGMEFQGKAWVVKSQVEKDPDLARAYKVQAIPSFFIFYQGKVVDTTVGAGPETADQLRKKLQELVDQASKE